MRPSKFQTLAALSLALFGTHHAALAADLAAGKAAFSACASCHQVGPDARNAFGPQLNGIVGRPAASVPGYGYSAALKNSKTVWDQAKLTAFIRDPERAVPGTKMRFYSLGFGEKKISDLLAYLQTFPPAR